MDALFNSLFQPGLNKPLHNLMNFTFCALFLVLATLVFLTGGNIHVIALLAIAFGLWLSVNWWVSAERLAKSHKGGCLADPQLSFRCMSQVPPGARQDAAVRVPGANATRLCRSHSCGR